MIKGDTIHVESSDNVTLKGHIWYCSSSKLCKENFFPNALRECQRCDDDCRKIRLQNFLLDLQSFCNKYGYQNSNQNDDSYSLADVRRETFTSSTVYGNRYNIFGCKTPLAIFVHQWSKMGGSSVLMLDIAKQVAAGGIPSITFDLRGVGLSSGKSTFTGHKESEDVQSVCHWAIKNLGAQNIWLIGSSAGAPIAGSAIDAVKAVRGYIGIGYVFGCFASIIFGKHFDSILKSIKPKLFVHAGSDAFTSNSRFLDYYKEANHPKMKYIVNNLGHFELESPQYYDEIAFLVKCFVAANCLDDLI